MAAKAELNAQNRFGDSALIWAAQFNNPEMLEALLAAGANANIKDYRGKTVLMFAARSQRRRSRNIGANTSRV